MFDQDETPAAPATPETTTPPAAAPETTAAPASEKPAKPAKGKKAGKKAAAKPAAKGKKKAGGMSDEIVNLDEAVATAAKDDKTAKVELVATQLGLKDGQKLCLANPDDLVLVGLDKDAKTGKVAKSRKDSPLFSVRVNEQFYPLDDEKIDSMDLADGNVPVLYAIEGTNEVVTGRMRTRYGRAANVRRATWGREPLKLPVIFLSDVQAQSLYEAMVLENTGRTPESALDEGHLFADYIRKFMGAKFEDASYEATGKRFGVSGSTVESRIKLTLKASPALAEAVSCGAMGYVEASRMASKPQEEQEKVAKEKIKEHKAAKEAGKTSKKPKVKKLDKIRKLANAYLKDHPNLPATAKLMIEWAIGGKGHEHATDDLVIETLSDNGK